MQKRWYDLDPTLSLAVSLMKTSNDKIQLQCASYIVTAANDFGVKIKENALNEAFSTIMRRWYDKDNRIQEAFEYLKAAPMLIQKQIAQNLLDVLQIS